jgi:hypothetical protein
MDSLLKWLKAFLFPSLVDFKKSTGNEHILTLGRDAQELLKNAALDAAFKKIEDDILTAWKMSAPKDKDARENLYYRMEGLALIRIKLQGMVNNMLFEENRARKEQ